MIALAGKFITESARPSRAPGTFQPEDAAAVDRRESKPSGREWYSISTVEREAFKVRGSALDADRERAWNRLRGLEPLSMCDWPGRTVAVLFMGGCNLHCPTCHNFEMAWSMETLPRLSRAGTLGFLKERAKWLDGITVTGGEPSTVPGLAAFLTELREFGLPIKMDSNGMQPDVIAELLERGLVEQFAVDVKGPWSKYPALTGSSVTADTARDCLEAIFRMASEHPDAFYFRTTQVPALSDADLDTVRGYLPPGFHLTVQKYKPPRRTHAPADSETGRTTGDVVDGPHRRSHLESAECQRNQGPSAVPEARPQG